MKVTNADNQWLFENKRRDGHLVRQKRPDGGNPVDHGRHVLPFPDCDFP